MGAVPEVECRLGRREKGSRRLFFDEGGTGCIGK